jgi:phage-related protein
VSKIGRICPAIEGRARRLASMGRTILNIIGILLAIWLFFTVLGMLVAALKFLIWIGVLAVVGAIIVTVIGKMAKSR